MQTDLSSWQRTTEVMRTLRAERIKKQGYCKGCGSKVKKKLADRHVISCSVSHMNYSTED